MFYNRRDGLVAVLTINEIYTSIQGESTHAGRPCVFVRLTACDLRCSWCDTPYAFTEGRKISLEDVLQAVEVDFSGVERVRQALRESWRAQHGYTLTYLPFIAHAVCRALGEFPHLNTSVDGDALVLHPRVNLAIAVDLGAEGLVAPVVKGAESLGVRSSRAPFTTSLGARARTSSSPTTSPAARTRFRTRARSVR